MSKQFDETNRGAIWPNDRKETEKHPDFKGHLNCEGVEYWFSAWKRGENDNPKGPSLRFSITKKEPKPETATPMATDFDDEIPF